MYIMLEIVVYLITCMGFCVCLNKEEGGGNGICPLSQQIVSLANSECPLSEVSLYIFIIALRLRPYAYG